jgi:hypothetical protein
MKGEIMRKVYLVLRMLSHGLIDGILFVSLNYDKAHNFFTKEVEKYDKFRDKIIEPYYFSIYQIETDTPNQIEEVEISAE